jgi:hypothetical protein
MAALVLPSCVGTSSGGGSNSCAGGGTVFTGQARYEDKAYDLSGFVGRPMRPVRFALVEVRNASNGALLGSDRTDASGAYCVGVAQSPLPAQVKVRVKADAAPEGGRMAIEDYNGDVYYMESSPVVPVEDAFNAIPVLTIREDTPWKLGGSIGGSSASLLGGAFNFLDVAVGGIQFVHNRWGRTLPDLIGFWQDQQTQGLGTFFDNSGPYIHIKGEVNADSDEYDDDIILHEFGHFALWSLSKDTSRGGLHFINGNTQDARLAWSEGWANFFSAMVRDADPGNFSNVSGVPAVLIDALFTTQQARSLRFAYEVATPEAFVADPNNPANDTVTVTPTVFRNRVKYVTSEVSVASALWAVYAGGPGWTGIGPDGMLRVIEAIRAKNPSRTSFTLFWETLGELYPAVADAVLDKMRVDRLMTMEADAWGFDDTPAELAALTGLEQERHEITGLSPTMGIETSVGHTLFPAGDVDLFRIDVAQAGTYRILTTNLNDGADTYMRILEADGTPIPGAENDNYVNLVVTVSWGTQDGPVTGTLTVHDYPSTNGRCGPFTVYSEPDAQYSEQFYFCPPNAANRPDDETARLGDVESPEFLASGVQVDLAIGTYLVEVTRSPDAPPSAGDFGGYDLRVQTPEAPLP